MLTLTLSPSPTSGEGNYGIYLAGRMPGTNLSTNIYILIMPN